MKNIPGEQVSHYKILEKLGGGGMGVVYKAHDTMLDRTVALKFLPHSLTTDPPEKERLYHEARAAGALIHPNIAVVHEIGEYENQLFIVMEYVDGKTLRALAEAEPLHTDAILDIAAQVCEGLAAAHEKGIVHRDIKSDNIIVTPKRQAKITDFGLAKVKGAAKLTNLDSLPGTAAYMSPEQAQGEEVDQRSDIFSFGVVLYELLTGRLPFHGEHPAALAYSIVNEEPQAIARFNREMTPEIEHIVFKALAKQRDERYQHADEMLADLRKAQRTPFRSLPSAAIRRLLPWIVAAVAVAFAAIAVYLFYPTSVPKSVTGKSVAVLPFKNLSDSKEDEFFSDGITDDIIAQLSKIADLKVISRTSVMQYKGVNKNIRDIGRELDVTSVLEGSVRRSDNHIRIVAQLIDARNEGHLWADTYDRTLTQVFAIQSDVAQRIAAALEARLSPEEKRRIEKTQTENTEAYQFYLKGRFFVNKVNETDVRRGISFFEEAIARDSNYALAYAGLADGYDWLCGFGLISTHDAFIRIKTFARKALSLDATLAEPYTTLGDVACSEWNWTAAEENYTRAIGLNQNYAAAHAYYAWYLTMMRRNGEALREARRAVDIDPLWPVPRTILGLAYMFGGQFDSAMTQISEALSIDSTIFLGHTYLGDFYWWKGNLERAIVHYQRAIALGDSTELPLVAYLYARTGDPMKARRILTEVNTRHIISAFSALAYMSLGERDRAFECLETSYQDHDQILLITIAVPHGYDTELDSFRKDPRFQAFVSKMGLQEVANR